MHRSPRRRSPTAQGVEPMDLDLSSESPNTSRTISAFSNELESLDLDAQPVSSDDSWTIIGHTTSFLTFLNNNEGTSIPESKRSSKAKSSGRSMSAPLSSGLASEGSIPHIRPRTSAGGTKSSIQLSSRNKTKHSGFPRMKKRGYGILEFDSIFSHFPHSPSVSECQKKLSRPLDKPADHKSITVINKSNLQNKKSKMNCCIFLVPLVIPLFYLIVTVNLNVCKSWVHFSPAELEKTFNKELFGQHIAAKMISEKLQLHFEGFRSNQDSMVLPFIWPAHKNDCRPIVLSFHGDTGVGKTFVSRLVSRSFDQVQFTTLNIPLIFPHRSTPQLEAEEMYRQVKENFYTCGVNVFMVDEMDKSPDGAITGLSNAITYLSSICTPFYTTIFLLVSNTHASEINLLYKKLLNSSTLAMREEMESAHFRSVFNYNRSIRWYDKLVQSDHLDTFVPFLPLEKKHVVQCIKQNLQAKYITVTKGLVEEVLRELVLSESSDTTLSSTGCKRVSDKVDFVTSKKEDKMFKKDVSDL